MNELRDCRGFKVIEFHDYYDAHCTVQQSSLADDECVWVGRSCADPKILASKAGANGVQTDETTGWVPFPVPEDVLLHTRMHLTRQQAGELADVLKWFSETGEVKK